MIVKPEPLRGIVLHLIKGIELVLTQPAIAHRSVVSLDVGILLRITGLREFKHGRYGHSLFNGQLSGEYDHRSTYLHHYNHARPHQGRNLNGGTPYKVFMAGLLRPRKAAAKLVKNVA